MREFAEILHKAYEFGGWVGPLGSLMGGGLTSGVLIKVINFNPSDPSCAPNCQLDGFALLETIAGSLSGLLIGGVIGVLVARFLASMGVSKDLLGIKQD
jgi:hypothetical protein